MEDKNEIQNYNIKSNQKKSSKQFKKNSIPKPLKKIKINKNEIIKFWIYQEMKITNTYNKTSELSEKFKSIIFPVRKLSRVRTFFESGDKERKWTNFKAKKKKIAKFSITHKIGWLKWKNWKRIL